MTPPKTDRAARWDAVRARLAEIEGRLTGALAPDQRAIEEVFQQRAARLAKRPAAAETSALLALLVFELGHERYGIELSEIQAVLPFGGCTPVPGAPPALIGVINVRGEIRAVVDTRALLGLPPAQDAAAGYVVLVRLPSGAVGLKVDRIDQVRRVDPAHLMAAAEGAVTLPASRFVKALTRDTVIVLDAGAAFAHLVAPVA
jgi:purine-binding chemotaxis protein CheW